MWAVVTMALATTCAVADGGAFDVKLNVQGVERSAHVVVGVKAQAAIKADPDAKLPLVYVWHGWGGSSAGIEKMFAPVLPDAIAVFGQGLPRRFPKLGHRAFDGWQVETNDLSRRDLAFFDALHSKLLATGCVDARRVTSTGFSNGAMFSNVLACVRSDVLAGVAPLSGGGPPAKARCGRAVPALVVHGTRDRVLPFARAVASVEHHSKTNRCSKAPYTTTQHGCRDGIGCAAAVRFCVHHGRHRLPTSMRDEAVAFLLAQKRRAP